jgi:hypothetical protein
MRAAAVFLFAAAAFGQSLAQRGFFDTRVLVYPQAAPNDSGYAVWESLLRYEPSWKAASWLRFNASFDARFDSHRQVERSPRLDWTDRRLARPALSVRRLSAVLNKGPLTFEIGRQFIRWGKTDILNPTDRFAPKDFLNVASSDFLAVYAARATIELSKDTFDLVWQPLFTPSRTPLLNQRWAVFPDTLSGVSLLDAGSRFPGGSAFGTRWNHNGAGYEYSLSFYDGRNHLPLFDGTYRASPPAVTLQRFFPRMRMYGGDAAVPLKWITLKGEAAYFTSATQSADEYVDYVIQLERQSGEWFFVGGYAGEYITGKRSLLDFAPDRGLTKALLARAQYTIDTNRSLALDTAVRQNGDGAWLRAEYSQAFGRHWRATAGFTWIHGRAPDFLGQYHRNSYFLLALRYSF